MYIFHTCPDFTRFFIINMSTPAFSYPLADIKNILHVQKNIFKQPHKLFTG